MASTPEPPISAKTSTICFLQRPKMKLQTRRRDSNMYQQSEKAITAPHSWSSLNWLTWHWGASTVCYRWHSSRRLGRKTVILDQRDSKEAGLVGIIIHPSIQYVCNTLHYHYQLQTHPAPGERGARWINNTMPQIAATMNYIVADCSRVRIQKTAYYSEECW